MLNVCSVTDGTNVVLSQTLTVTINDVNDNDPVFINTPYTANVAETETGGGFYRNYPMFSDANFFYFGEK